MPANIRITPLIEEAVYLDLHRLIDSPARHGHRRLRTTRHLRAPALLPAPLLPTRSPSSWPTPSYRLTVHLDIEARHLHLQLADHPRLHLRIDTNGCNRWTASCPTCNRQVEILYWTTPHIPEALPRCLSCPALPRIRRQRGYLTGYRHGPGASTIGKLRLDARAGNLAALFAYAASRPGAALDVRLALEAEGLAPRRDLPAPHHRDRWSYRQRHR
jgi:hypothetical protein